MLVKDTADHLQVICTMDEDKIGLTLEQSTQARKDAAALQELENSWKRAEADEKRQQERRSTADQIQAFIEGERGNDVRDT